MKINYRSVEDFFAGCESVIEETLRRSAGILENSDNNLNVTTGIERFISECLLRGIKRVGIYGACSNISYLLDIDFRELKVPCIVDGRKSGSILGIPVVPLEKAVEEFGCEAFIIAARSWSEIESFIKSEYPERDFPVFGLFGTNHDISLLADRLVLLENKCRSIAAEIQSSPLPKIIYVATNRNHSLSRQSWALRKYCGWESTVIFWNDIEESLDELDRKSFSRIICLKEDILPKSSYLQLFYIFRYLENVDALVNVFVNTPGQELALSVMKFSCLPVIFQPVDLFTTTHNRDIFELIWGKEKVDFCFKAERYIFDNAAGVIHKESTVTESLISPPVRCPMLNFYDYVVEEYCMPSKGKLGKELKLAYTGSFHPTYWPDEAQNVSRQFYHAVSLLVRQGISVAVYGGRYHGIGMEAQAYIEWRLLEKRSNGLFKMYGNLPRDRIIFELSKYDFGILNGFNYITERNDNPNLFKTTLGTKLFAYLEAGIPVLVQRDYEGMVRFVEEYGVGIILEKGDIGNLKTVVRNSDYGLLCKNVEYARREKLNLKNNIIKLERFYLDILRNNSSKGFVCQSVYNGGNKK